MLFYGQFQMDPFFMRLPSFDWSLHRTSLGIAMTNACAIKRMTRSNPHRYRCCLACYQGIPHTIIQIIEVNVHSHTQLLRRLCHDLKSLSFTVADRVDLKNFSSKLFLSFALDLYPYIRFQANSFIYYHAFVD